LIDLHTHLLPGWDDGAKDWNEAQEMTGIAHRDGITKIALTPHVFRTDKQGDGPLTLSEHLDRFGEKAKSWPMAFFRGAEVFIHHDITGNLKESDLTINGSNYVFIEFPSASILPNVKDVFFNLMLEGYIPIISHPERNHVFRDRPELLYELVRMGSLGQVTSRSLVGGFGKTAQKAARFFMEKNLVHIIASDAHDAVHRPPKLSEAVNLARKFVGEAKAIAMVTSIPQAILDNGEIGDWGEPVNPSRRKIWSFKVPKIFQKKLDKSAN
jgi:protein-tyrosine phosphatase